MKTAAPSKFPFLSTLLLLGLFSLFVSGCTEAGTEKPVACTEDAKICPDGSAVGRVAPDCEFAACPDTTTGASSTFKEYKGTSAEQCAAIRFTCGEGDTADEYFSDDNGCGCVRTHNNAAVTLCSADYNPVCGWFDDSIKCFAYPCAETESNLCMASVNPKVAYTTPGECPAVGVGGGSGSSIGMPVPGNDGVEEKLAATDCTEPRPEACTMEYMPVCGQKEDDSTETYGNKCTACADSSVLSYYEGEC
jgi:hypothetical protein